MGDTFNYAVEDAPAGGYQCTLTAEGFKLEYKAKGATKADAINNASKAAMKNEFQKIFGEVVSGGWQTASSAPSWKQLLHQAVVKKHNEKDKSSLEKGFVSYVVEEVEEGGFVATCSSSMWSNAIKGAAVPKGKGKVDAENNAAKAVMQKVFPKDFAVANRQQIAFKAA